MPRKGLEAVLNKLVSGIVNSDTITITGETGKVVVGYGYGAGGSFDIWYVPADEYRDAVRTACLVELHHAAVSVTIHVPMRDAKGRPFGADLYSDLEELAVGLFGGYTWDRHVEGGWSDASGGHVKNEHRALLIQAMPRDRGKLKTLLAWIKMRFGQEEVAYSERDCPMVFFGRL